MKRRNRAVGIGFFVAWTCSSLFCLFGGFISNFFWLSYITNFCDQLKSFLSKGEDHCLYSLPLLSLYSKKTWPLKVVLGFCSPRLKKFGGLTSALLISLWHYNGREDKGGERPEKSWADCPLLPFHSLMAPQEGTLFDPYLCYNALAHARLVHKNL